MYIIWWFKYKCNIHHAGNLTLEKLLYFFFIRCASDIIQVLVLLMTPLGTVIWSWPNRRLYSDWLSHNKRWEEIQLVHCFIYYSFKLNLIGQQIYPFSWYTRYQFKPFIPHIYHSYPMVDIQFHKDLFFLRDHNI